MTCVLVLGALHYDVVVDAPRLPEVDETLPGRGVDYRFGGKGGNQAVAAARMGAAVTMAGRVGRDAAARTIFAALDVAGIDRTQVVETDAPTGMSVAIALPSGDYGAVIVPGASALNDGLVSWQEPPATVLLQNEIPDSANLTLVRSLPDATRLIVNAAPARPLRPDVMTRTDLLVVNLIEAQGLTGLADPRDAATALARLVRGDVVVTLGSDGAIAACDGTLTDHPAVPVKVVSSHGAGDFFTGALAARLTEGDTLAAAIRYAQIAAALFVSAPIDSRDKVTPRAVVAHIAQYSSR